jgi:hypothetical protein
MAGQYNPSVLTHSQAKLTINAQPVGFAKNIAPDFDYGAEPIRAIGSYMPKGVAYTSFTGNVSADFHLLTENEDGVIAFPTAANVPDAPNPIVMTVNEKATDRQVYQIICRIASEATVLSVDQISNRNIRLLVIDVKYGPAYN